MFRKIHFIFLIITILTTLSLSGEVQGEQSFPFDKQCLKFDKTNFKVGQALLDLMKEGDFPQYCVLYSLSNYQVKEKKDDGYFIIGSKLDLQHPEATTVFLKSNNDYGVSNPVGQWAYFVGMERFTFNNGVEKEYYTFQEQEYPQVSNK